MKNPSWYENPPEDSPEGDPEDDALDYGDYLYDQQKDARAEERDADYWNKVT